MAKQQPVGTKISGESEIFLHEASYKSHIDELRNKIKTGTDAEKVKPRIWKIKLTFGSQKVELLLNPAYSEAGGIPSSLYTLGFSNSKGTYVIEDDDLWYDKPNPTNGTMNRPTNSRSLGVSGDYDALNNGLPIISKGAISNGITNINKYDGRGSSAAGAMKGLAVFAVVLSEALRFNEIKDSIHAILADEEFEYETPEFVKFWADYDYKLG